MATPGHGPALPAHDPRPLAHALLSLALTVWPTVASPVLACPAAGGLRLGLRRQAKRTPPCLFFGFLPQAQAPPGMGVKPRALYV